MCWRQDGRDAAAPRDLERVVRAALAEAPTLHRWAAARSERSIHAGRGTIHVVRLGPTEAAVRRFHRGGWMAPLLGDRYLGRPPRPFVELATSERARERGIATPRVLAAVAYPARPGYRAEIATEWLSPGHGLGALLVPGAYPEPVRAAALEAAGEAVGRAHAAGLDHPDLNVSNLFLQPAPDGRWTAWILDLDRARFREGADPGQAAPAGFAGRNVGRLERSIGKARRAGRARWTEIDRTALLDGWRRAIGGRRRGR
ncbi:MAG TPA: lipopolysaccharide kinase InaA family protein [Gemmatimonadota bacterium]|nr:lipopolysaccharide kinase InaA family protein [Gemmatimonadota bacterium]